MKKVKLTQNKYAVVDDDDFERINKNKWYYCTTGYARRSKYLPKYKSKGILMHREITKAKDDQLVDHINRDRLDNRKSNLRLVNDSLNGLNRKTQVNNTSGYRGVYWSKQKNKWQAVISIEKKRVHLGFFKDKKKAHIAYENKFNKVINNL